MFSGLLHISWMRQNNTSSSLRADTAQRIYPGFPCNRGFPKLAQTLVTSGCNSNVPLTGKCLGTVFSCASMAVTWPACRAVSRQKKVCESVTEAEPQDYLEV